MVLIYPCMCCLPGTTDLEAETRGLLRVIDESGEDYLYPAAMFFTVELPLAVRQAVFRSA